MGYQEYNTFARYKTPVNGSDKNLVKRNSKYLLGGIIVILLICLGISGINSWDDQEVGKAARLRQELIITDTNDENNPGCGDKHRNYTCGVNTSSGDLASFEFQENELTHPGKFPNLLKILMENPKVMMTKAAGIGVSENCFAHTLEWITQVSSSSPDAWALQMFDAFAKPPEGIMSGHINPMGDFDECLGIDASKVKFSENITQWFPDLTTTFGGMYCTMLVFPNNSDGMSNYNLARKAASPVGLMNLLLDDIRFLMIPTIGTCFPSSCSQDDVGNLTNNILGLTDHKILSVIPLYCTAGKPKFDAADISFTSLLGILFGLCIIAGCFDYWLRRGNENERKYGTTFEYVMAFSLFTNIRKVLTVNTSPDDLGCLHGIRVLTTAWVILIHTWAMPHVVPSWNMVDLKKIHDGWSMLTISNATTSVDTFFVMSGLLVSYNLLRLLDKTNGKFNLPMFYVHRYIRITPAYAIIIGILATIMPHFGSGPYWIQMDYFSEICQDSWWTNLLYVNNFVNLDRQCHLPSWYLACDMQFYFISPLLIYPLWRWKKLGRGLLTFTTIISIIVPAAQFNLQHVVVPNLMQTRDTHVYGTEMYSKPYSRIQTYLVGIALGYLLHTTKGMRMKLPKMVVLVGWIVSTVTCLSVVYGIKAWIDPKTEIPIVSGTIYAGFSRFSWAVSIAWIIFACSKGYGGIINDILSWKAFVPLGRLTLCVYITSYYLQMIMHLNLKQPLVYDPYTMTNIFLAHLFMSFLVGFLCTVIMESPFITIEKLLFGGDKKSTTESNAKP